MKTVFTKTVTSLLTLAMIVTTASVAGTGADVLAATQKKALTDGVVGVTGSSEAGTQKSYSKQHLLDGKVSL